MQGSTTIKVIALDSDDQVKQLVDRLSIKFDQTKPSPNRNSAKYDDVTLTGQRPKDKTE